MSRSKRKQKIPKSERWCSKSCPICNPGVEFQAFRKKKSDLSLEEIHASVRDNDVGSILLSAMFWDSTS